LTLDGAGREARFELALALGRLGRADEALAHLREILEDDPYDAEACYQASRQLIATRRPGAVRLAGHLMQYFQALREQEGASSRDQHLALAGEAAMAALERAKRQERLGRFDRALAEAARARQLGAAERARAYVEELWTRQGFSGGSPTPAALGAALREARQRGDAARAGRLARLLCALEPRSRAALEQLAAETASDPALIAARLHFLKRLSALDPGDEGTRTELLKLRAAFAGGAPPR
jgi:tetratricopeptide (TPR) repeat protein